MALRLLTAHHLLPTTYHPHQVALQPLTTHHSHQVALQLELELEAKEGDRAEMEEQLSGAFGGVIKELQALIPIALDPDPNPHP